MNYAIDILEKEKHLIIKCLSEWQLSKYPEARKDRDKKLLDLDNAIKKIKDYE
tara:strand:+ start:228 stop:386 length:159 start_codon:yes stop_codon:yes gene_type:complete